MTQQVNRCRSYRYRLDPTVRQVHCLLAQLELQRELYNAAREERINAWRRDRRSISYFEQCRELKDVREFRPEVFTSGVRLCRGTLKWLDRAFLAFYQRAQQGGAPGFPRFKPARQFNSLQWEDSRCWKIHLETRRLHLPGIGDVKARYHRNMAGTPKAITVKREGSKWWVSVRCSQVPAEPLAPTGREVGLDLGVVNVIATSEGELIAGRHFASKSRVSLREAQQALSRSQEGSRRHSKRRQRVAEIHRKVANRRRDAAHQLSRRLVNEFDFIALEDLDIARMVRARKREIDNTTQVVTAESYIHRKNRNRCIYDAGWGMLMLLIQYKAESAGRIVSLVDPRHTSQTCFECGHVDASNRVNQAVFSCRACGHEDHADVNAARNILRAGRALHGLSCVDR